MIDSRPFQPDDLASCLEMLGTNVPGFFADTERKDYLGFLRARPTHYRVYVDDGMIIGACGLKVDVERRRGRIQWIMTRASARGNSLGSRMMNDIRVQVDVEHLVEVDISASQKSAPFFARYGAWEVSRESGGWGPGLDRIEMVWKPVRDGGTPGRH